MSDRRAISHLRPGLKPALAAAAAAFALTVFAPAPVQADGGGGHRHSHAFKAETGVKSHHHRRFRDRHFRDRRRHFGHRHKLRKRAFRRHLANRIVVLKLGDVIGPTLVFDEAARSCRGVKKVVRDTRARPVLMGATGCYDEDGEFYIVPGSRYVIKYP